MSSYRKRRTQLKRHDRGCDRHAKGVNWLRKMARRHKDKARHQAMKAEARARHNDGSIAPEKP